MADPASPNSPLRPRRLTILAAGVLLVALALVIIYTNRGAFRSPHAFRPLTRCISKSRPEPVLFTTIPLPFKTVRYLIVVGAVITPPACG